MMDLRALEAGFDRNVDPEAVSQKKGVWFTLVFNLKYVLKLDSMLQLLEIVPCSLCVYYCIDMTEHIC